MNADFNVGFIQPQGSAEQLFNRASLREFHGRKIGKEIDGATRQFERSIDGLNSAIKNTNRLLGMLRTNRMLPAFVASLRKHLSELRVNDLPRVSRNTVPVRSLRDILLVIRSELVALRAMTRETIAETKMLQPKIEEGQFVATVLQAETNFNQAKIGLAFGRAKVEDFISLACHATIIAAEDTWPQGFGFLTEPKRRSPVNTIGATLLLGSMAPLLVGYAAFAGWKRRSRTIGS